MQNITDVRLLVYIKLEVHLSDICVCVQEHWKVQEFPLARIKKIMRMDEDVRVSVHVHANFSGSPPAVHTYHLSLPSLPSLYHLLALRKTCLLLCVHVCTIPHSLDDQC